MKTDRLRFIGRRHIGGARVGLEATSKMPRVAINHLVRGNIDRLQAVPDGHARLAGWVFHEDTPIDKIEISLGGEPWTTVSRLHERPDIQVAFKPATELCPHLLCSGFDVTAVLPDRLAAVPDILVKLTPFSPNGVRLAPLFTYYCSNQNELASGARPPIVLQERVGGSKDFVQMGAQAASLVMTCVGKFKLDFQSGLVLDWGCGCGRIISHMKRFVPPANLFGCDIDSAAINWNKENISGPKFMRVEPYPPTPYADRSFDVVYGISVMTHLDEETQMLWLRELKRITRPGAILALSVIGEQLRTTNMPASLEQQFTEKGFAAFVPYYSDLLSEFAHPRYYKEAYHTVDYIATNWSRYFEVLEYVQTGHQDIVILRSS